MACWQCGAGTGKGLFCPQCKALQEPPRDYFRFFDLERKLTLDADALQRRFYQLSKSLHPDRYTRRPEQERRHSLDATSVLNDGYRTLRDPVSRAEYVLKDNGFDIGEQRSKDVPPELLEEVFEMNMALEELKAGDETARPQLDEARRKFEALRDDSDRELADLFSQWDRDQEKETLAGIRRVLNRRRYISNLLREAERAMAAEAA